MKTEVGARVAEWGLAWMIRVRWIAAAGILAAPAAAGALDLRLPLVRFAVLAAVVAGFNALLWRWTRRGPAVPELPIHAQIVADLLALTWLFHLAGGVGNPLLSMYAFHVVIAGILLSRAASFLYAGLAVGLVSLLARVNLAPEVFERPRSVLVVVLAQAAVFLIIAYLASLIGEVLRRREASLVELNQSLAEQDRRKSQYVLMLGHSMLLRLQDIERALTTVGEELPRDLPESPKGLLARARQWLAGLRALVQDVVDLSRMRASPVPARSLVYLPRLVYKGVAELEPQAREKNVAFAVEMPPQVLPISGNAAGLSQALDNLLRNAITYSRAGGTVRVSLIESDGWIELAVEDEGIGISSADQAHIFEEFYRAGRAREVEASGTGLGLAIVKYVAEQHGGEVRVSSEEGKGSRFTLRLPGLGPASR
jgi:signal transduction histidine kinase